MSIIIITLIIMFALILLSIPVSLSIGLAVVATLFINDIPLMLFTQKFFSTFESFPMMAIPGFILSGAIMQHGTLANSLLDMCRTLCGHMRGGLGQISVVTSLFYGALCGAAAATTAAVGGTMIPAMEKEQYPPAFAAAVNAASGSLGMMIPPSIPLIIYGAACGVSVSDLFIAGIVPGILTALSFMVVVYLKSKKHNYGVIMPRATWKERCDATRKAGLALGVPVIVLGGIYGGITTPTEASVIAVMYALAVETLITGSMNRTKILVIAKSTLDTMGMLFMILICANALGTLLMFNNLQEVLINFMKGITDNVYVLLMLLFLLYMALGCFMEVVAVIIILAPMLLPVVSAYGIDPVHFGIFTLVSAGIGVITPPVGNCLYVAASIANIDLVQLSKSMVPFIAAMSVIALLIGFVPWLSLCLL